MSNTPLFGQGEGVLSHAAGLVDDARADFDALARTLDGQIQGARSGWAGQGGNAFFALHQAWTEKQAIIVGALEEFSASLTGTERDNVATDEGESASFQSLSGRLG